MNLTTVSARQSAFLSRTMLMVAEYMDIYGGMGVPPNPRKEKIPMHKTKTIQWRRYEQMSRKTTPIVEGVTPDASTGTYTDYTATLSQYGDYIILTDVSLDTAEDPLLSIFGERMGDAAIGSVNLIREGVLIAGTNVMYSPTTGSARTDVTGLITKAIIQKAVRTLSLQKGRRLTRILSATQGYNTTPIPPTYIGVCSTYVKYDMEETIGESGGFVPMEKYSNSSAIFGGEFGKLGHVRWKENEDMTYWADAGGNVTAGHKSTSSVKEDVFPNLIFAKEAYGIVPFGGYTGRDGIESIVKKKGSSGVTDALDQRASVGYKTMQTAKILNENWMIRIETGATA